MQVIRFDVQRRYRGRDGMYVAVAVVMEVGIVVRGDICEERRKSFIKVLWGRWYVI